METGQPLRHRPAMTAILAAAAQALDITGEVLPGDIAPDNAVVLFLPEPIYHRSIAATWPRTSAPTYSPLSPSSRSVSPSSPVPTFLSGPTTSGWHTQARVLPRAIMPAQARCTSVMKTSSPP